jgi:hypothetical protein
MNCANHSDIAAVAFCRTCGKPLCQTCTRDVRGVIYCESCLAARLDGTAPAAGFVPSTNVYPPVGGPAAYAATPMNSGPNPTVAGILGAIPLGLGAVYCGQYAKGLAHLAIVVAAVIGFSVDLPWQGYAALGIFLGFFWVYQIIDAIRSAKAIQMGQPAPDPFGLAQTFGTGEKLEGAKIPTVAAVLIGLGILFLLHTAGLFEMGMGLFISLILIGLGVWLFAKNWGLIGANSSVCYCEHCRTRRFMGPAILITVGVLFLLDSVSHVGFGRTWPAILLVIGVVKLMQSNASYNGHVGPLPPGSPGFPPQGPPPMSPATPQDGVQTTEQTSSGEVKNV